MKKGIEGAEFHAITEDYAKSQGWFVYYTARPNRTLYGDAMSVSRTSAMEPLPKRDRRHAENVMVWARRLYVQGKALMSQRKNRYGETEYLVRRT